MTTAERKPNDVLRDARLARQLSRGEFADATSAAVYRAAGAVVTLDDAYVGRLERGEVRWPAAIYRRALCDVLGTQDADLGFFNVARRPRSTRDAADPADLAPGADAPDVVRIPALRVDLGRRLAGWREAAGLTQDALARRIAYSRTSVALALPTKRQRPTTGRPAMTTEPDPAPTATAPVGAVTSPAGRLNGYRARRDALRLADAAREDIDRAGYRPRRAPGDPS